MDLRATASYFGRDSLAVIPVSSGRRPGCAPVPGADEFVSQLRSGPRPPPVDGPGQHAGMPSALFTASILAGDLDREGVMSWRYTLMGNLKRCDRRQCHRPELGVWATVLTFQRQRVDPRPGSTCICCAGTASPAFRSSTPVIPDSTRRLGGRELVGR